MVIPLSYSILKRGFLIRYLVLLTKYYGQHFYLRISRITYYHLKSENSKMEKEADRKEMRATFFEPRRMWGKNKIKQPVL